VASLLRRAGLEEKHLLCGVHSPFDPGTRRALLMAGQEAGALHNNCSGKHAAMLVTASYLGLSLEDYVNPDHDVQVAIRGLIAYLSGVSPEEIGVAVDGCTAPAYQIPLRGFALAMARLAAVGEGVGVAGEARRDAHGREENGEDEEEWTAFEPDTDDDEGFPVSIGTGLRQVWRAMKNHPVLVAGTRGRICTDLMRMAARCGVPLVAKSGAEGFYAWAAVHRGQAIGFASKIEDGAERARNTVLLETLFQLEVLPPEAEGPLASYHRPKVLNLRQQPVGELRPRFRLSRGLA